MKTHTVIITDQWGSAANYAAMDLGLRRGDPGVLFIMPRSNSVHKLRGMNPEGVKFYQLVYGARGCTAFWDEVDHTMSILKAIYNVEIDVRAF